MDSVFQKLEDIEMTAEAIVELSLIHIFRRSG